MPDDAATPDPVVEALFAAVLARYGEHIPPDQAELVRERIARIREAVAVLNAYPLSNADEPDSTFAVADA